MATMAVSLSEQMFALLPELRYQPTLKRVRAYLDDQLVVDTVAAVLVWEPARIVPQYAVPEADLTGAWRPAADRPLPEHRPVGFGSGGPPLLDPSVPFAVHTAAGQAVEPAAGGAPGAGFRLSEPPDGALAGYVLLDFAAFDWCEEDEPVVGHPRDPFHRIDVRASSRRVRISDGDVLLADSARPRVLFEGTFPLVRYYLPWEDVAVELVPSGTRTTCAYKGHATHHTAVLGSRTLPDVAWSYPEPLSDAREVAGLVCFYQERLDLVLDGVPVPRVRTPWS